MSKDAICGWLSKLTCLFSSTCFHTVSCLETSTSLAIGESSSSSILFSKVYQLIILALHIAIVSPVLHCTDPPARTLLSVDARVTGATHIGICATITYFSCFHFNLHVQTHSEKLEKRFDWGFVNREQRALLTHNLDPFPVCFLGLDLVEDGT